MSGGMGITSEEQPEFNEIFAVTITLGIRNKKQKRGKIYSPDTIYKLYMNPEQAKAHVKSQINVIETVYNIRITNLEEVIEAIIEKTRNVDKILTICTALNSWVAMNASPTGVVEIPLELVNELMERIL
uniref:Uncharacterized protein n=1 Tax=Candidatus Methanophaga sp. ANME-1 ERB7 TaxID=2759913 RepID=A0A7G9Z908_9EURY|nr:hypothetical protein HGIILDEE_00031 [Methanosarcinales archaeon ANME-1 ERB7]